MPIQYQADLYQELVQVGWNGGACYQGVHNKIDIIDLRVWQFETPRLDSGFRRRDGFEASSLFVIPAKAGI